MLELHLTTTNSEVPNLGTETKTFNQFQHEIGIWAKSKGWQPWPVSDTPSKIALLHSEASEMLEEYRNSHAPTKVYTSLDRDGNEKPEGIPVELADIVIRAMEFAANFNIDLAAAVQMKMDYNQKRPYRHNKVV